MKNLNQPWCSIVKRTNQVPVVDPTGNGTVNPKKFILFSDPFKAGIALKAGGGLTLAAIMSTAGWIALTVGVVALLVMGINALDAVKGDEIREFLKEEPDHVEEKEEA